MLSTLVLMIFMTLLYSLAELWKAVKMLKEYFKKGDSSQSRRNSVSPTTIKSALAQAPKTKSQTNFHGGTHSSGVFTMHMKKDLENLNRSNQNLKNNQNHMSLNSPTKQYVAATPGTPSELEWNRDDSVDTPAHIESTGSLGAGKQGKSGPKIVTRQPRNKPTVLVLTPEIQTAKPGFPQPQQQQPRSHKSSILALSEPKASHSSGNLAELPKLALDPSSRIKRLELRELDRQPEKSQPQSAAHSTGVGKPKRTILESWD